MLLHRFTSLVKILSRDHRGTTAIEFAVVAPLFFLLLFATMEFGLVAFTQMALEGAVDLTGRTVSISSDSPGCDRVCQFRALITTKTSSLLNGANVNVAAAVVGAGGTGGVGTNPDTCLTSPPSTPATCPAGTPFIDNNGNGLYDGPGGGTSLGNAGDVVELSVTLPYQVQFPFLKSLFVVQDSTGHDARGFALLSANTIIKNEPN